MRKILSIVFAVFALAVVVSPVEAGNRPRGGNKCCGGTNISQVNVSSVNTAVVAAANTGGNTVKKNAFSSNSVTTGAATTTVSVTTTTGSNVALVSGCCCNGDGCGDEVWESCAQPL